MWLSSSNSAIRSLCFSINLKNIASWCEGYLYNHNMIVKCLLWRRYFYRFCPCSISSNSLMRSWIEFPSQLLPKQCQGTWSHLHVNIVGKGQGWIAFPTKARGSRVCPEIIFRILVRSWSRPRSTLLSQAGNCLRSLQPSLHLLLHLTNHQICYWHRQCYYNHDYNYVNLQHQYHSTMNSIH